MSSHTKPFLVGPPGPICARTALSIIFVMVNDFVGTNFHHEGAASDAEATVHIASRRSPARLTAGLEYCRAII